MSTLKDTYYWKCYFRDGTSLDQYQYESVPADGRKAISLFKGLTLRIELVPTRPGYPKFVVEVPKDAAPMYVLAWDKDKQPNGDGSRTGLVAAIGIIQNGIMYMRGIDLDTRDVKEWSQKAPRKSELRDFRKAIVV